jgi:hypothetical protein
MAVNCTLSKLCWSSVAHSFGIRKDVFNHNVRCSRKFISRIYLNKLCRLVHFIQIDQNTPFNVGAILEEKFA